MLIGKRINGRYKLLDMVGGGGMANVYLARDMILDRDVALKILRMDFNNDDEFIKRFNREAQSATSLVHPNIVSIYDVGEDGDIYYIVMEYVKGLTLKQYIQKNFPLSIEESINIMEQITAAISNAHHNGIIHRDIKPQNILVDEIGNVKITDFGIALALSATNITQTNAVLGSVHYLSPEQARGGMANKKSDIYSLGIVMFELLTGRLPFSGESAVSIALKHLQSETPSPKRWNPDIPQSVENIILKATAKDSYYRYESVDEMHEQIRTSLKPERLNEPVFTIPEDHDATKAIPIITNDNMTSIDETIIRGPEKNTAVYDEPPASGKSLSKKKGANSKKKKKRKRRPLLLIAGLLIILLLLGGSFIFFPDLFGPKEISIPDLSGEEYDDAIVELLKSGLEPGKTIELSDEKVPQEQVIKTEPRAGKVVKEGTMIDIYQSTGKETVTVSDYIGRNIDSIETLLEKMDFKKSMISEEFDDSSPGTILTQVPSLNTEVVPSDTAFEFTVSKGPEQLPLKNLTEFNKAGLDDYAKEAGIKINVKREEYNSSVGVGLVISQEPSPGTKVEKGSTVDVVLSKGKKEIPPKTVVEKVTIEYDPEVPGEEQTVKIYIEDMIHSMTEPQKTFKLSETTTKEIEFLVSYEKQAGYKIVRDDRVYLEGVVTYPKQ